MPKYTLTHPDENASHQDVVAVVHDYDSEIKILDGGIGSVDVEMTQQQHDDFLMINGNWTSRPIQHEGYAEVNVPGINLKGLQRHLARKNTQPQ